MSRPPCYPRRECLTMKTKVPVTPIPDSELLQMAIEFDLGPEPLVCGRPLWWHYFVDDVRQHRVTVKNMGNPDEKGPDRWGIFGAFGCLNKMGEWEYQGLPSSRRDDFYQRCRYDSVHEAIYYYRRWSEAVLKYARDKYDAIGLDLTTDMKPEDYKRVIINYDEIPSELLRFEQE